MKIPFIDFLKKKIMPDYYTDDNEMTSSSQEQISPSGRFKLIIRQYTTKKGCWHYSRGTVYRVSDNEQVCDIKRNYHHFSHSFVEKNKQEYLITGRSYMSQTIINLDTGEEFEPTGKKQSFCWAVAKLSPDENILVVDGCEWAAPYEYRFFDFTNLTKGWKWLESDDFIIADEKEPQWVDNETVMCYETDDYYLPLGIYDYDIERLEQINEIDFDDKNKWERRELVRTTYKFENGKMVKINKWVSDDKKERRKQLEEGIRKYNEWLKDFKANDSLYLKYQELLKKIKLPASSFECQGICHKDWCPHFDKKEKRWCRRIVDSKHDYTVDLEWAVDTGPIKLVIFKNDKQLEDKFFEHSVEEMERAFDYVKQLIQKK